MLEFNTLWVEKYRPKKLDDMVLSESNRKFIEQFRATKDIPNLLFVGNPGTGKSTLAKIIVTELLQTQYLYINASDENGIDTIRNKVVGFAQTRGLTEAVKVIILDEADGLSPDSQRALRNVIEEYCKHTRFILTANYKHRIIEPVQSRCQPVDLTFDAKSVGVRVFEILSYEKIQYETDVVLSIIKSEFPDIRSIINTIQRFTIDKVLQNKDKQGASIVGDLYTLLTKGHVFKARQYMIQKQETFNNDYQRLLKELFDFTDEQQIKEENKKLALVCIHDHIYKASFVVDQEINAYVCLINLSRILSSNTHVN